MKVVRVFFLLTTLCGGAPFAQTKTGTEGKQSESGSQDSTADSKVSAEQKRVTAERMKVMQKLSSDVKGSISIAGKEVPLRKHANPILRFNDPSRSFQDGALWMWGEETGRPQGLVAIERYNRGYWSFECVSMTTKPDQKMEATLPHGFKWRPVKAGLVFQQIADHDAPMDKPFARLQQFKAIARRFRFRETYAGQDSELRLLAKPIHRYSNKEEITDAAMFVFSNGTNPEAVPVIECQKGSDTHTWQFGVLRLSSALLKGWLDKKEVFLSPQQYKSRPREPYLVTPARASALGIEDRTMSKQDEAKQTP